MRFGACRSGDGCVGAVAWRRLMGGRSPAGSSEARMAVLRADGAAGGSDGWLFGCLGVASGAVRGAGGSDGWLFGCLGVASGVVRIAGGQGCGCSDMRTEARRAVRIAAFGVGGSRLAAFIVRVPQAAPREHVGKKRCGRGGRGGRGGEAERRRGDVCMPCRRCVERKTALRGNSPGERLHAVRTESGKAGQDQSRTRQDRAGPGGVPTMLRPRRRCCRR